MILKECERNSTRGHGGQELAELTGHRWKTDTAPNKSSARNTPGSGRERTAVAAAKPTPRTAECKTRNWIIGRECPADALSGPNELAERADRTPRAVAFHKYRTMQYLNLNNNVELIHCAPREGIVPVKSNH